MVNQVTRPNRQHARLWLSIWGALIVLVGLYSACTITPERCQTGADCPPPFQVCVNHSCVLCRVDADCSGSQACKNSSCVYVSDGAHEPDASPDTTPDTRLEPPTLREAATETPPDNQPDTLTHEAPGEASQEQPPETRQEATPEAAPPEPLCSTGDTRPCYTGPKGTAGKGQCKSGLQTCGKNTWSICRGSVLPTPEICDGIDNNCDGKVDDTFPKKGQVCYLGRGACERAGKYICSGRFSLRCDATPGAAISEKCNKIDDDCDGKVDEGCTCTLNATMACGSRVGACQMGTQTCRLVLNTRRWSVCNKPNTTGAEKCDGIDNDCDGTIDEGCCIPTKKVLQWAAHPGNPPSKILGIFFGDKQNLITASAAPVGKIWEFKANTFTLSQNLVNKLPIVAAAVDYDQDRFYAFALSDHSIAVWEKDPKLRNTLLGHTATIRAMAFSNDGKTLATGGDDKTVRVWAADKGKLEETHTDHTDVVLSIAFSPNDRRIFASGSADKTILQWEIGSNNKKRPMIGHTGAVVGIAWRNDGQELYSIALDRTLRRWDANKSGPVATIHTAPTSDIPQQLVTSPNQNWLVVLYKNGVIRFWDTVRFQLHATFTIPNATAISWSSDSKYLAVGDTKGNVSLWECP